MLLCCLIPIALIVALVAFGYGGWAIPLIFLLCPLMHILLMGWHRGRHREGSQSYRKDLEDRFSQSSEERGKK